MGTYIFKNLEIDAGFAACIKAGGGDDSVIFENVTFTGSNYASIRSECSNLIVESCSFTGTHGGIDELKGNLFVTDTYMELTETTCISTQTSGTVTIENSYLQSDSNTAVYVVEMEANLTIKNSTIIGALNSNYYSVYVQFNSSYDNKVAISGTLFTCRDSGNTGPAIRVFTPYVGGGTVTIENCMFEGLSTESDYPFFYPIVDINTNSGVTYLISGTTFSDNGTLIDNGSAVPILNINGANGKIVNSTFLGNEMTTNNTTTIAPTGCVQIGSEVNIIKGTFVNNYNIDYFGIATPAALQLGPGSIANLDDNIFYCNNDAGGSNLIIDSGSTVSQSGNLDVVSLVNNIFSPWLYSDNNGLYAGYSYWEMEIKTVPILPFGDADGKGVVYTDGPIKDQRNKDRLGKPDIGSVTIESAMFDANGGLWEALGYYWYTVTDPYYFMDEQTIYMFERVAVSDENGSLDTPPYSSYPLTNGSMILLGWSTDPAATFPDTGMVDDGNGVTGENGVTYYAVWSTDYVVSFIPGNGQPTVNKTVPMGGTVTAPTYDKVINGMKFVGWFWVEGGKEPWNPASTVSGNITLYGYWEEKKPEELTVYFLNVDSTYATKSVKYGNPVDKPKDPVRKGYIFKGWYTASTGGSLWNFNFSVIMSMTLFAQWEEATIVTVTFYPENGGQSFSVDVVKGERTSVPSSPSKDGYTFKGWFTSPARGIEWDFNSAVNYDMSLYAQWTEGSGGGGGDNDTEKGTILVAVVFASIVGSFGLMGVAGLTTNLAVSNVFQHGMFGDGWDTSGEEKNRRAVIFEPRNGRPSWASSVFNGRLANQPKDPKPPHGMKLSHWELEGGKRFDFMTPITKNTHLFAVYVPAPGKNERPPGSKRK